MSFDEKTDRMDWKDEFVWFVIAMGSGLVLAFLYDYFLRFPGDNFITVAIICCVAFYILSILVRIQNHRGQAITAKTAFDEKKLKLIFPIIGFVIGLAVLVF